MRTKIFLAIIIVFGVALCSQPSISNSYDCVWTSFDGTPELTPTDVEVVESNPSETTLRIVVHGMCVEDTTVKGDTYQLISVPGMTAGYEFGKPGLPAVGEMIALCTQADSLAVTLISFSVADTFENFNVFPVQRQAFCGSLAPFCKDSTFYSESDFFYPLVLAEGDSTCLWHVLPTGHVRIFPFQYNPVSQSLIAYDTVYVTLEHPGPAVTDTIRRSYNTMYSALINYEQIASYLDVDTVTYSPHKLFIVADTLIDDTNLERLVQHEKKKGFQISKMKVTDAGGSPPTPEQIKSTISSFYADSVSSGDPVYVVLVGDHDQVPAKIGTFGIPDSARESQDILSDEWYELMANKGAFGMANDYIPDLMVGRIPTNHSDTLAVIIDVKIKNDTTASVDVAKELLVADGDSVTEKLDPGDGLKRHYVYRENKKLIKKMLPLIGFQGTEIYGSDGGTNAAVKIAVESGVGHLNYRGHGTATTWRNWDYNLTDWTKADVSNLNITDTEPIVWCINCFNNEIDYAPGCIGEEWVKKGKALAHFGSSRGSPTEMNSYFDKYIHYALANFTSKDETTDLGHVINLAKTLFGIAWQPSSKGGPHDEAKTLILEYLLLGDPEQTVWTNLASLGLVNHKNGYVTGPGLVVVSVESEGEPVSGAVVCLLKESVGGGKEEVFGAKYTNDLGQASFDINPKTPGTMHITAWGKNLKLYSAEVPIVERGWREGDGYKMHFPQLPDTLGIDVNFTDSLVLADDWMCSQSGPVSDIHFWFSARGDWFDPYGYLPTEIASISVSIHSNITDPDGSGPKYSMPGDTLWSANLASDSSIVSFNIYAGGDPGWYDPSTGLYIPNDHEQTYQCNITDIPDPFVQKEDSIYWLVLSIETGESIDPNMQLGWKTADLFRYPPPFEGMPFADVAVWGVKPDPDWAKLSHAGQPLDLAFVIGGDSDITGSKENQGRIPGSYRLGQNYPNPFNPTTTIQYEIPKRENVLLAVYNVKGERVRILVDRPMPGGRHDAVWDGRNDKGVEVASGVYFCRIQAGTFVRTRKLVFLK